VPDGKVGASLYIRPLVFASEGRYGVKISDEYLFVVMAGPVAPFYSKPLKVKIEDKFIRASKGGTGTAKCAGNYGGSFYATRAAKAEGFDQVLWTDLSEDLYIEESGTMNVFFLIGETLFTPPLSDSILEGITRDSIITLAKEMGVTVEERKISANDITKAHRLGQLHEAFGTGTAAVTVPISVIGLFDAQIELPPYNANSLYKKLQIAIADIRTGKVADRFGWNTILPHSN
jgi:branched-chain amino acid aminotransferase